TVSRRRRSPGGCSSLTLVTQMPRCRSRIVRRKVVPEVSRGAMSWRGRFGARLAALSTLVCSSAWGIACAPLPEDVMDEGPILNQCRVARDCLDGYCDEASG